MKYAEELSKRLSDHVWMLAGEIGARSLTSSPEGLEQAGAYIEHVFTQAGYDPTREQFTVQTFSMQNRSTTAESISFPSVEHQTFNVIAEKLPGSGSAQRTLVIGAHYDSVYDCPAANDNASGVAALLEIARIVRNDDFQHRVRFVAFTNEEPPFFRTKDMGSFRHAQRCKDANEKLVGMICLETIGYYTDSADSQRFPQFVPGKLFGNKGNFVGFVSNINSARLLNSCLKSFQKASDFPCKGISLPQTIPGVEFSDQYNFWQLGYPAIMVTDTANYRYPHYHESEDTPDKLNYEHLARVVAGLVEVVRHLAK